MSIITKRGDHGDTDLMFGKKARKTSKRVAALGSLDEVNAILGVVRTTCGHEAYADTDEHPTHLLESIQAKLFGLMGELACEPDDLNKYSEKGYHMLTINDLDILTTDAQRLESQGLRYSHWAIPGEEGSAMRAMLDLARTVVRRAEREVLVLHESEESGREGVSEVIRLYLNRLSDALWIMARQDSKVAPKDA